MSSKDKKYWLRDLTCEGCYRRCRYRDFRAFGPYAGGFAPKKAQRRDHSKERRRRALIRKAKEEGKPLPHGNRGRKTRATQEFVEQRRSLLAWREAAFIEPGAPLRRGGILGHMHGTKHQMWEQYTTNCPCWGEAGEGAKAN